MNMSSYKYPRSRNIPERPFRKQGDITAFATEAYHIRCIGYYSLVCSIPDGFLQLETFDQLQTYISLHVA